MNFILKFNNEKKKSTKFETELMKIKKKIKYTSLKEQDVQLNSFVNETIRLKNMLDEMLADR